MSGGNCVGLHPYGPCGEGVGCNRPDPAEVAEVVHRRIREAHAKCDPAVCALRAMWVEDVQAVIDALGAVRGTS